VVQTIREFGLESGHPVYDRKYAIKSYMIRLTNRTLFKINVPMKTFCRV